MRNGMTLMSVMVAVALAGIVALAVARLLGNQSKDDVGGEIAGAARGTAQALQEHRHLWLGRYGERHLFWCYLFAHHQ